MGNNKNRNLFFALLMLLSLLVVPNKLIAKEGTFKAVPLKCIDGKYRQLGIYIPKNYNKKYSVPLFVWLHGGVNGTTPNRGVGAVSFLSKQADKGNFICIAPSGEHNATWFDPVGFNHIIDGIRYAIQKYSIDTSKIFVGGSSDGGTACYLLATRNIKPHIKGFVVCSGYIGILKQLNFPIRNLISYSWYIIHTGKDRLFPMYITKQYVGKMEKTGIDITFHPYPDLPHGLDYAQKEKPKILNWIMLK